MRKYGFKTEMNVCTSVANNSAICLDRVFDRLSNLKKKKLTCVLSLL